MTQKRFDEANAIFKRSLQSIDKKSRKLNIKTMMKYQKQSNRHGVYLQLWENVSRT